MQMMKCYLANDSSGHFVTIKEAINRVSGVLTCTSCGCSRLILHVGEPCVAPWFEHDQQTPVATLMKCANLDPQVKADARHAQLRKTVGWLAAPVAVKVWYCVICQSHYQGGKTLHYMWHRDIQHRRNTLAGKLYVNRQHAFDGPHSLGSSR
ncbi:putative zinc ribbon protein [Serratia fonticola]|uniref:putative zinc ribbon protein n=1 Tax=Serratia fonticola TaxID=47917 RepID=UPI003BB67E5D